MGVSLYYTATQSAPLTDAQAEAISALVGEFNGAADAILPFEEMWEHFHLYDRGHSEGEVFSGATGMPRGSMEYFTKAIDHWCDLLARIRNEVLPDAEWVVTLDGSEFGWNADNGKFTQPV